MKATKTSFEPQNCILVWSAGMAGPHGPTCSRQKGPRS